MSDFSHPTYHTCRKTALQDHCALCGLPIEKGERYARYAAFVDGRARTCLEHTLCRDLFEELLDPQDLQDGEYDLYALQEWHPASYGIPYNEWLTEKLYRYFQEDAEEHLAPLGWVPYDGVWGARTIWRAPDAQITFGEYGHRELRHVSRGIEDVVVSVDSIVGALRYLDCYRKYVLKTKE